MTKFSHQLTGISLGVSLSLLTHNPTYLLTCYVGSLFPDVDTLWNSFNSYRSKWYGHRGITHSLLIPLFLSFVVAVVFVGVKLKLIPTFTIYSSQLAVVRLLPDLLAGFTAGYWLHVLLDSMSPSGVPKKLSYYPRFKLWTLYRTGEPIDYLLAISLSLTFLTFSVLLSLPYLQRLTTFLTAL